MPLTTLHKGENCLHHFTDDIKPDLFVKYVEDLQHLAANSKD